MTAGRRKRARETASLARVALRSAPAVTRWNPAVIAVYAVLLVAVLVIEIIGVRSGRDAWPTITDIVKRLIGLSWLFAGALLGLLAWFPIHFYADVGPEVLVALAGAGGALGQAVQSFLRRR